LRVFLDTNVLVSAFITHGLSAEIFRIIIKEHELIIGNVVLEELQRILIEKFNMPDIQVDAILQFLNSFELVKYSDEKTPIEVRDKDDEKVLALALKSKSDVLVTGDKDLLDVREKESLKTLTPRDFFELARQR
jgi:uncharacterized protein